jgi:alpha-L-fucosidase
MRAFFLPLIFLFVAPSFAQVSTTSYVDRNNFQDRKFGLFIHWGVSSMLGAGEWVMNNRGIRFEEYKRLREAFYPSSFDAAAWVGAAKKAGMKYIVFITRHHDGFSNWNTNYSDWKITNTPYGKDVLKMLAAECKRQGMQLGLYYSTLDWSRNDYPYETGRTGQKSGRTEKSNYASYLQFMKNQITELLTNYGPIMSIWLDGHWDQTNPEGDADRRSRIDWKYDELYSLIHRLQPACLIGNNHHLTPFPGEDFQMFEKDLPGQNTQGLSYQAVAENLPLETCETMNNSWGYNITDHAYKSSATLIRMLVNAAGLNTNLLLNVGPMPSGKIQPEFLDTLQVIGKWTEKYGRTIYSTRGIRIPNQDWGVVTTRGSSYFLHILKFPESKELLLPNFKGAVQAIRFVENGQSISYEVVPQGLRINLRAIVNPDPIDLIIEISLTSTK